MIARRFEDLVCWQLARELERRVIAMIASQPARDDFDFCRQIRKSASSAPRNIAEGFGRFLPGDFAKFVRTARGSLEETKIISTRDERGATSAATNTWRCDESPAGRWEHRQISPCISRQRQSVGGKMVAAAQVPETATANPNREP
jgi:four helix bundle protein